MMTERISRTPPYAAPPDASTASDGRLVLDLVRDQQNRWRSGDPVPVEAYLRQHPGLRADSDGLMDLICNEWVLREELGEKIILDEYVRRFPDMEQPLRMQWEVRNVCRAMTMPSSWPTLSVPVDPAPIPAIADSDLPSVSGYEVVSILGRGGMGVVYKARHIGLNRLVALKMLRAGSLADSAEHARFKIEAEAVARLQHPNI